MKAHAHHIPSIIARGARRIASAAPVLAVFASNAFALAQTAEHASKASNGPSIQCDECHTCVAPTPEAPCLRTCPRALAQKTAEAFSARGGPSVVILDELENLYLPVPFDHRGHADMAQMAGGCSVCHHYTPEGLEHPACKTCHEVAALHVDIRKPGLKGAYHRQCMGCHREWSGETSCAACHQPKTGASKTGSPSPPPTKDDLIGRMHPPIPEPEVEIYQTKWESDSSSRVSFRHKAHIHDYDLRCSDCHREDNCTRCHEEGKKHEQRVRTLEEHHKPCADCHRTSPCDSCHILEGGSGPPPFDHARTGWPLRPYHARQGCRACHPSVPYTTRDRKCEACHASWTSGAFDHRVTGQALGDNHARADCADCHKDNDFERKPICDSCHEESDNVSFPARRPGPTIEGAAK